MIISRRLRSDRKMVSSDRGLNITAGGPARGFDPALSFVLLMLRVHLFDDQKLGNIAVGQMKLHRSPLGNV
jgi:hypothetical protein